MAKQLIKVEPELSGGKDNSGADFWKEDWPDPNRFNLRYQRLVSDDRKNSPKDNFNQEIWIIEGSTGDIDAFVASGHNITRMTPDEAKTLVDIIRPGKTVTRECFGKQVSVTIPPWLPPSLV